MPHRRLLILDDEVEIGRYIERIAISAGFKPEVVSTAEDFRNRFSGGAPPSIMLDLQMPDIDGIEMLRWLAEAQCRAKIVIMSGFDQKVIDSARRLGTERGLTISGTLQKPFRVADVIGVLEILMPKEAEIDTAAIRQAITEGQFYLVYQPKVALGDCEIGPGIPYRTEGFEALLRWKHPSRGMVSPDQFLPIAETSGLMDELTEAVLLLALHQQRNWMDQGLKTSVAVNVSAQNMREAGFADRIAAHCSAIGVSPSAMAIELTETAAMADPVTAMDILTRLRIKGFRLSIDDFGSGYSSLAQLHMLPFSELKIDRAFVMECDRQRQSQIIVKTMIDLAHNLGLIAVAEGVENAATLNILRELGCDMAQGYFVAKPLMPDDATKWLQGENLAKV